MLRSLKDLFDTLLAPPLANSGGLGGGGGAMTPLHRLHLATAVLLVEVMRADSECSDAERRAVLGVLQSRFALADDEQQQLLALAEHSAKNATDFHAFTSTLNDQLSFEDKVQVVEAISGGVRTRWRRMRLPALSSTPARARCCRRSDCTHRHQA